MNDCQENEDVKAKSFGARFFSFFLKSVVAFLVCVGGLVVLLWAAWWLFVYRPCMKECMTDLDEAVCAAEVCDVD